MGLDMYAFKIPADEPIRIKTPEEEYGYEMSEKAEEFTYWRKNNALHGWMERLAEERHGWDAYEFNCTPMKLTEDDLDRLRSDILSKDSLKPTEGFFFGAQVYLEEEKKQDLEFVEKSLSLIAQGFDIYYYAWW